MHDTKCAADADATVTPEQCPTTFEGGRGRVAGVGHGDGRQQRSVRRQIQPPAAAAVATARCSVAACGAFNTASAAAPQPAEGRFYPQRLPAGRLVLCGCGLPDAGGIRRPKT